MLPWGYSGRPWKLGYEAAEREEATAELARRVLRFLFRARDDQSLRFES
jgi:hypothetical protein